MSDGMKGKNDDGRIRTIMKKTISKEKRITLEENNIRREGESEGNRRMRIWEMRRTGYQISFTLSFMVGPQQGQPVMARFVLTSPVRSRSRGYRPGHIN